ncbi:Toll-like receptor 13 [Acipenser ruthenus]|uniref:Toll-like receptor 13 n=1 Tax=Acipenser ruthenus TaxID=7906 RepID=A0A444V2Z2_ACIRT|nr:Toll-like receptor 13 [Acipenser ruthenus]
MHGILLIFVFFLLESRVQIVPTAGFSLRNCTVQGSLNYTDRLKVLCYQMEFYHVPSDIPRNTKVLDISGNRISQLRENDFRNLTNLKNLNASRNQICHVAPGTFRDLTGLQELNLTQNKLSVLSSSMFHGLLNLTVLKLAWNRIQKIDPDAFLVLANVRLVNLTSNALHQLEEVQPVLKCPHLEELSLGSNGFSTFSTEELTSVPLNLRVLDLSSNPITSFNVSTDVFPHLVDLDLSHSGPKDGLHWEMRNRSFLTGVKTLSLNGTRISTPGLFPVIESFASSLEVLHLNDFHVDTVVNILKNVCLSLPKLQILSLRGDNLSTLQDRLFERCSLVYHLDLSDNQLKSVLDFSFRGMDSLRVLYLSHNQLVAVPNATQSISNLEYLDFSYNLIDHLQSWDFNNLTRLKHLILVGNKISTITGSLFGSLFNLQELKLGINLILSIPEPLSGSLHKLEILELRSNKLSTIKKGTFQNLRSLKSLNLVDNQIADIEEGAFRGLVQLRVLLLGSNKLTRDTFTRENVLTGMPSLTELQIFDNYLEYESNAELKYPPFKALKSLNYLAINSQGHNGLIHLPSNFLEGLSSLKELHAGNLNLDFIHPSTFNHTPHMSFLDISKNALSSVDPKTFQTMPDLTEFILSQARLPSFDFLAQANLSKLKFLRARGNEVSVVNKTLILSLPKLKYLDLQQNPFMYGCENAWFLNWSRQDPYTQVIYLNKYSCGYPDNLRGMKLEDLRIDSCTVDLDFIFFVSTSTLVTLTMVCSFIYHFLRWQVVYAYHLFQAFLYDRKQKPSRRYEFDAFVSYNTHDEPWVLRELLPNLEQGHGWKLCLHHRDFQPGKPIIDNIVDNIYKSRKTLCIISRHYLESEWCSREIQVASFRLFDEQKDVLVLVFLEDIPNCQLSPYHRMRKLVKKKTYLNWPKCEEETRLFWHKLNTALETREEPNEESPILSGLETCD